MDDHDPGWFSVAGEEQLGAATAPRKEDRDEKRAGSRRGERHG
jgi:hypothetical protein